MEIPASSLIVTPLSLIQSMKLTLYGDSKGLPWLPFTVFLHVYLVTPPEASGATEVHSAPD